MKTRLIVIGLCALLMAGAIFIVGVTLSEEREDAHFTNLSTELIPSIPVERGVFKRSTQALDYQKMPEGNRTLHTNYTNRAYPGAPPVIPHVLVSEKGIGGQTCLQCHENGGYVDKFDAFAPVTPHPELVNCRQCHVPQTTTSVFKSSNWVKADFPGLQNVALPGAPPMIPHDLNLRENCLACHAGPGAPIEIRVTHPERVNCRQCHLPLHTVEIFARAISPK